jgi:pimeloyl-ACP methyl ester carboxylesterase
VYADDGAPAAAGLSLVARLAHGTNVGVVLDGPEQRIIAFRGTDELADWRTNLNLGFRRTPWGRVHRGFQDAAERFWPEVAQHASDAAGARRALWLTGHSLGGAIALLVAARLSVADTGSVHGLCTFGQPAVGGGSFCRHCDECLSDRYIRCVNHTDVVAGAPSLFREHGGSLWYFDIDGHLHHEVTLKRNLLDTVGAPRQLGGLSQVTAHGMERYLPLLRALV